MTRDDRAVMSSHNHHLVLALQQQKQAIFDTNAPRAEQHRLWCQRKAEIEAFLASDRATHSESETTNHRDVALARATSNVGLSGSAATGPGHIYIAILS